MLKIIIILFVSCCEIRKILNNLVITNNEAVTLSDVFIAFYLIFRVQLYGFIFLFRDHIVMLNRIHFIVYFIDK